ncbi:hypothetical protein EDD90_2724 [Streptomyces sp. Ag109_O5-1]|uniref:hypothetical protein n=1 Tax=Streptomyces sp. Ag109_O5-1 TaxID=1938851 RepID=UPI000F4F9834|nr:hypothetical protein [Streptomyces sp. Ag109_O5-1]RPE39707.1 hypothetical protein EDD90_2724 [Streptomyces sp. Ag109_O5-1]
MTTATPTLVKQQTDLVRQINQVLDQHPLRHAFRLVYAPQGLDLAADEVLVQDVDVERRIVELRPKRLSELDGGDVVHESQVVDPGDTALHTHALEARGRSCLMTIGPDLHLYR